jgi:phage terminase small subunit
MPEKPPAISGPPVEVRVVLPPENKFGPAMRALKDPKKQLFVLALLKFGDVDYTRAAKAAGYTALTQEGLYATGHMLAHDPKIQTAIVEEAKKRLQAGVILAVTRVIDVLNDPLAAHRDHLRAAEMVMSRVGMPAESKNEILHTHETVGEPERLARIIAYSKELGIDPVKLLGNRGVTITDAEFTEVAKP